MNNLQATEQFEAVVSEALELLQAGKSEAEVLAMFPQHHSELVGVFQSLTDLRTVKQSLTAPQELLHRILDTLPSGTVTAPAVERYSDASGVKGRVLSFKDAFSSLPKIVLPVGVVAVIMIVFIAAQYVTAPRSKQIATKLPVRQAQPTAQTKEVTPLQFTAVKATLAQTKSTKINTPQVAFRPDTTRPMPRPLGI